MVQGQTLDSDSNFTSSTLLIHISPRHIYSGIGPKKSCPDSEFSACPDMESWCHSGKVAKRGFSDLRTLLSHNALFLQLQ